MLEVDECHLWLVVSFVLMGPDPYPIAQILWLLLAVGSYFITPVGDGFGAPAQEGIGGQAT